MDFMKILTEDFVYGIGLDFIFWNSFDFVYGIGLDFVEILND